MSAIGQAARMRALPLAAILAFSIAGPALASGETPEETIAIMSQADPVCRFLFSDAGKALDQKTQSALAVQCLNNLKALLKKIESK